RARAADAVLAPEVGPGQREVVAQKVRERLSWLHRPGPGIPVDGQLHVDGVGPPPSPARWVALSRARRTRTRPTCTRYAEDACRSDGGESSRVASSAAVRKASSAGFTPIRDRSA